MNVDCGVGKKKNELITSASISPRNPFSVSMRLLGGHVTVYGRGGIELPNAGAPGGCVITPRRVIA